MKYHERHAEGEPMRFAAPTPASGRLDALPAVASSTTLPVMRGQVFEVAVGSDGQLATALPLPEGARVRVIVL